MAQFVPTLAALALSLPAFAQEREPVRVALVLSGGGGRAIAQAGVLEVLEELHVPIDLVVGCDAGALVGGLYAAGQSPAEIVRMLTSDAWVDAVEGREGRRSLSWRRRVEDRDFLFEIPVALRNWSLGLPNGLLRTRRLNQLLTAKTLGGLAAAQFDELPTPFRAVASDLVGGTRVVLERDLARSILASMATPVLMPPVQIDGRLLVSGSLTDALPIDVALDGEPRVMIVVDCTTHTGDPAQITDMLDVAQHVLTLESVRRRARQLALMRPGDVLLEPDLGTSSPLDFRGAEPALAAGRKAARDASSRLAELALPAREWEAWVRARGARVQVPPRVRAVVFEDSTGIGTDVLEAHVDTEPGEIVRPETLAKDLERLYGLDLHERIDVALENEHDDEADLVLRTRRAVWQPVQTRIGGLIEGDLRGDASFALGLALNWRPLNRRGGEWRNRVELGNRVFVGTEFYQPLDASLRWFVSASASWNERRVNLTADEDVLAEFDVSWLEAGLDVGRVLGDWGELRVGARTADGDTRLATGDPADYGSVDFRQGGIRSVLSVDTLDATGFPREGTGAQAEWWVPVDRLGGDEENYLRLEWFSALTTGRTTFAPGAMFGTSLGDGANLANSFSLGGFLNLSGLQKDEIAGPHALLGRLALWHELGGRTLERKTFAWYVGGSLEVGNVFLAREDIELSELILASSLFLGVQTWFGPAYLGVGAAEEGRRAAFIAVGGQF